MAPQTRSITTEAPNDEQRRPLITAHESAPDWLVLTENGNTDGWIATDWTVDTESYR